MFKLATFFFIMAVICAIFSVPTVGAAVVDAARVMLFVNAGLFVIFLIAGLLDAGKNGSSKSPP